MCVRQLRDCRKQQHRAALARRPAVCAVLLHAALKGPRPVRAVRWFETSDAGGTAQTVAQSFAVVDTGFAPSAELFTPGSARLGAQGGGLAGGMNGDARDRQKGTVKWFNASKGFGFVTPEGGGEELFVHQVSEGRRRRVMREGGPRRRQAAQGFCRSD